MMFFSIEEVEFYENDLSTKKKTEIKSTWFQKKDEYGWRKKSIGSQKTERKKKIISIGHNLVLFSSIKGVFI